MKRLSAEVLKMFGDMQRDRLDLHVMFESSGNEPAGRGQVLDAVDDLVREDYLQSAGGISICSPTKGRMNWRFVRRKSPGRDNGEMVRLFRDQLFRSSLRSYLSL